MEQGQRGLSRRAFFRVAAVTGVATVAVACAPTAAPTPSPPEALPTPAAKEPVPVHYWDPSTTEEEIRALDEAYLKFNEVQGEAVVEVVHGKDEEALLASVAAGDPPDVYWRWGVNTYGSWINKGVLQDLTPFVEASSLDWDRFVPIALESMKWRAKFYGMPLTSAGIGLLYWNKPLFEEAGLDPELPPKDLDELLSHSDKMTVRDDAGNMTAMGFYSHLGVSYWPALFNAKYWDAEDERITPTDPGVVASFEWMAGFYQHYGVDAVDRFTAGLPDWYSSAQPVCHDLVATLAGYEWDHLFMTVVAGCEDTKFGYAKMVNPAGHPDYPTCSQGAIALVIPTGAAHPKEGWAFMEYLQGWEPTGIICAGLVNVAQVLDAVNFPAYRDNPVLKLATELSTNVVAWPGYIPVAAEYSTELGKAYDLIVHGKVPAEEGLQAVYDQVQPALDKALGKA